MMKGTQKHMAQLGSLQALKEGHLYNQLCALVFLYIQPYRTHLPNTYGVVLTVMASELVRRISLAPPVQSLNPYISTACHKRYR